MIELFMQEVINSPILLGFISASLGIALVSFLLRISLFNRLMFLNRWDWAVAATTDQAPQLIQRLRDRMKRYVENLDEVNTFALVDYTLAQERVLGLSFEQAEYITRVSPNLLIAIGLLGTFLGITMNLVGITISLPEIMTGLFALKENGLERTDSLLQLLSQLREPLMGMSIAFISSLASLTLGIFLTVVNSLFNTTLARQRFFTAVELYLDNELASHQRTPTARLLSEISRNFDIFLTNFEATVTRAIERPLEREAERMTQIQRQTADLARDVYNRFMDASGNIVTGSRIFEQAVTVLEQSQFADKLNTATTQMCQFIDQLTEVTARSQQLSNEVIELTQAVMLTQEYICQTMEKVNKTQTDFEAISQRLFTTTQTFIQIDQLVQHLLTQIEAVDRQVIAKSEELSQITQKLTGLTEIAQEFQKTLGQNQEELKVLLSSVEQMNNQVAQNLLRGNEILQQIHSNNQHTSQQLVSAFDAASVNLDQLSRASSRITEFSEIINHEYNDLNKQLKDVKTSFENYITQRSTAESDRQRQAQILNDRLDRKINQAVSQFESFHQELKQLNKVLSTEYNDLNQNLAEAKINFENYRKQYSSDEGNRRKQINALNDHLQQSVNEFKKINEFLDKFNEFELLSKLVDKLETLDKGIKLLNQELNQVGTAISQLDNNFRHQPNTLNKNADASKVAEKRTKNLDFS
ncbi:hypothetical protein L5470_05125 [Synechococcus sp. PCC 6717]|nr:hypothetical protein [Synechococcus sp. PCC 6717]